MLQTKGNEILLATGRAVGQKVATVNHQRVLFSLGHRTRH
jgi:hypothetical protein